MFHDVSHAAARRVRIRAGLPVEHPGVLDEMDALLDRLPDPEHLTAEQRAARYCQVHHIVHWRNGGKSDLNNLALLCSRCHTDLHLGLYTISIDPHGIPRINPTPRAPP